MKAEWQLVTQDNLPPLWEVVWLYDGGTMWLGGRAGVADGWQWGNTHGRCWHNGERWDGDLETGDDLIPTHWMRLPGLPK